MLTFPCPGTLVRDRTHPRHKFGSMVSTGSKAPIWTMIYRCVEPAVSGEDKVSYTGKKYRLLTKCEVKMAGYWPSSFFACLWTETESRSINTQKKNEANIKPS